ncbi:MAG: hypothetical protein ACW967_05010 [Candidatus Hodarchaeales archaeon]|jgi:hypothetical protein
MIVIRLTNIFSSVILEDLCVDLSKYLIELTNLENELLLGGINQ